MKKKLLKISLFLVGILFFLWTALILILNSPTLQTWLLQKTTQYLTEALETEVHIEKSYVNIYSRIALENVLVRDLREDTLLFVEILEVEVDKFALLSRELKIKGILLQNPYFHLFQGRYSKTNNLHDLLANFSKEKQEISQQDSIPPIAVDSLMSEKPPLKTTSPTSNKDFPISISLQYLHLNQVRVHLENQYLGNDTWIGVDAAIIDVDSLDIQSKILSLEEVNIHAPDVYLCHWESQEEWIEYPGYYTELVHLNESGWTIGTKNMLLKEGKLHIRNDRKDTELQKNLMNFANLDVLDIQIEGSQLIIGEDSIGGILEHLSAKEKSGFILSNLSANVALTPHKIEFDGLCIITPNSYIGDYVAMSYPSFHGFYDFNNYIRMDANFDKSILRLEDIGYFVKGLSNVKLLYAQRNQPIELSGKIKNKISRLRAEDLELRLANTYFSGNFKLSGLPDITSTNIDFKVQQLRTNILEVRRLFPDLQIPSNFDKLGNLAFSGRFSGFPSDFVADGTLRTNVGKVGLDMKMVTNERIAAYSGDLSLVDFQLGNWLDDTKQFGLVSFSSRIKGEGLRFEDLKAGIDGNVQQIQLNGYDYRDLSVKGEINQRLFSGNLLVNDPNLQLNFDGLVDLNKEIPKYDFTANIGRINLHRLNLSKKKKEGVADIVLSGRTQLKLEGDNVDNIEGNATLANVRFQQGQRVFDVKKLRLESNIGGGNQRNLKVESDVLDAYLEGSFTFAEMLPAFKNYLYHYFPHHFNFPQSTPRQSFDFNATLKKPVSIIQAFVPKLEEVQEGTIEGRFDSQTKKTYLDVSLPSVTFDSLTFHNFYYNADSESAKQFDFSLGVSDIYNNRKKKSAFPEIALKGFAFNDSIDFDLQLANDTTANWGALAGVLSVHSDTMKLQLGKTIGAFNYDTWKGSTGYITFKNKDYFTVKDILLQNGNQQIKLRSRPSKSHKNYTEIELANVIFEQFQQIPAVKNQGLKGIISGQVDIRDVFEQQKIIADLHVADFVYRGQEIGLVSVGAKKSKSDTSIRIFADVDSKRFSVKAEGYVHLPQEKGKREKLDFDILIKDGDFAFIEAYVGHVVSNSKGNIRGALKLYGNPLEPTIEGEVLIIDGATTVDYLRTRYSFHNQKVFFSDKLISVKDGRLTDKEGNSARVDAKLYFNDFVNLSIDARIETMNERFLALNTQSSDNDQYYGTAYASGVVNFNGLLSQLQMYVNARSEKGTVLNVPINYDTDISQDNFYTFINKEKKTDTKEEEVSFSGLNIVLDFELTPDAEIQFIFDMQAGDIMRGRGNGDIQMKVNTIGDFRFDMYGKYTIDEGSYLFTLQNLVNKYFKVEKGGTVVFAGDPYKALLDVNAIYSLTATRSDLIEEEEKNLLMVSGDDREVERALRRRIPVDVYMTLTGVLEKPDVAFDIRLPELGTTAVDNMTANKIASINRTNLAELNKQVFGLLVLNRFLPAERFEVSGTVIEGGVITTVSEFLSNQLSNYLGELVSNLIPDSDFNVIWRNYQLEDLSSNSGNLRGDRNEIELTYTQRLFNDKVSVDIGGNFDVGNNVSNPNGNNVLFAADFVLEYKFTPDGRFKMRLFNKTDYDIFNEQFVKTGAALFWTKEFERFSDLFKNKKKDKQQPIQDLPIEFLPPKKEPKDTVPGLETILDVE